MEPLLNNLIKATGWSIFHSLWQGAIIYGILLLIVLALPKLQPKLKHNLAFGAICLIFICYVATFFSLFKLPVAAENTIGSTTLTLTAEYYQYMSTLPQQISSKTEYILPYIVSFYGVGLCLQLFILCLGYKRILDIKKDAHFKVPADWKASFEKLVMQLNLRQHISFHLSDKINVPLVMGYFKPVVLFPLALASQLDMDQVEAILIHELSHIRRNDYLLNLFKTGIETLLFFNPFVWLSGRFINIEREHACDDLVLKFTGRPMTYAHALLKLEISKDKSSPAFSMAATGKNQHLYQRIKRITDMKTNYMNARQQIFTITLAVATVISLAWVKPLKAEKISQKANQQKNIEVAGINIQLAPVPPKSPKPETPIPAAGPNGITAIVPEPPQAPEAPAPATQVLPASASPLSIKNTVCQDTTKKKLKYSIVTIDEKGNKKEYRSVKEMPENIRKEVIKETFNHNMDLNTNINIRIDTIINSSIAFLSSPEWKKSMANIHANAENAKQYFNSAEWKKQQDEIRKNAENIKKYFNSAAWKKQQELIRKNAEEISKQVNSREFKQQMEEIKKMSRQKEKEAEDKKQ